MALVNFSLESDVALVTGAASGIGKSIARRLLPAVLRSGWST